MDQDQQASIYTTIPGGPQLLEWFGRVPSFHDAEIIDLHLKRGDISKLRIHGWNMTTRVQNGQFVLEKHAVVQFSVSRITYLDLDDFNHQNVIDELVLSREDTEEGTTVFQISLEPCYGLPSVIRAEDISVSYSPGKPE
ncbi:MAG: Imm50 family immunity protein [Pseudomonadota bacterium]